MTESPEVKRQVPGHQAGALESMIPLEGLKSRFCISDRLPGHADAGARTTFGNYCCRGWEFSFLKEGDKGTKEIGVMMASLRLKRKGSGAQQGAVCCDVVELYRVEMVSAQHSGNCHSVPVTCNRCQGRCPKAGV